VSAASGASLAGGTRAVDVVLVNAPQEKAREIARALVERRLAACVNVVPAITSIYRWQGAIEEANEATLLIKTRRELLPELTEAVRGLHPYELPEIIAFPVAEDRGNAAYLDWVYAETERSP
jgi:periplasmic divalent cation tolerance protein